ncbi:hypothetical protein FRC11_013210 [Ceratobasidium sp. 423]|nr:hypothetical protein FRC11_013210 [Ceratobasidium sp. 423]
MNEPLHLSPCLSFSQLLGTIVSTTPIPGAPSFSYGQPLGHVFQNWFVEIMQSKYEAPTAQLASTFKCPPKCQCADAADNTPSEPIQLTLPPTIEATLPVSDSSPHHPCHQLCHYANECWYFVVDCNDEFEPTGTDQDDLLKSDVDYQGLQDFWAYKQPASKAMGMFIDLGNSGEMESGKPGTMARAS